LVIQQNIPPLTVEDFIAFATDPQNAERRLEWLQGEVSEKTPGSTKNLTIAFYLGYLVQTHCEAHQLPCYINSGDGGYRIGDSILAPDFAYKPTPTTTDYPDAVAPRWVMEVISPTDKPSDLRKNRQVYLEAGILVWEAYPDEAVVEVYAPQEAPRSYATGSSIPVPPVPDLTIEVARIFR
jgi:Uma2 family endonuclease